MPTNRKACGRDSAHKLKNSFFFFFFLLKRSVSLPFLDKFFRSSLGFLRAECLRICREKQFFEKNSSCSVEQIYFMQLISSRRDLAPGQTLGFAFQYSSSLNLEIRFIDGEGKAEVCGWSSVHAGPKSDSDVIIDDP
ncbi:hypothetical protein LguiA_005300 [Lonicera macranthoides]